MTVADSERALRVLETSQAPGIYFPPAGRLAPGAQPPAQPVRVEGPGGLLRRRRSATGGPRQPPGRSPSPSRGYEQLRDYVAFYPQSVDACWLDDERVEANAGSFYGGWITGDVQGPFKGAPGTLHW